MESKHHLRREHVVYDCGCKSISGVDPGEVCLLNVYYLLGILICQPLVFGINFLEAVGLTYIVIYAGHESLHGIEVQTQVAVGKKHVLGIACDTITYDGVVL